MAIIRPLIENQVIPGSQWIAGFTSGEGSFIVKLRKSSGYKTGSQVLLRFQLAQHSKDEQLMRSFIKFFNCGNVYINKEYLYYQVEVFKDNIEKIIPLFAKYQIEGVKAQDFKYWCLVADLMKQAKHRTEDGLNLIRNIVLGMNSRRSNL